MSGGWAVRVPVVSYRQITSPAERKVDSFVAIIGGVFILICVLVWALAIAKLVDLYGSI
jgi:hypothetical protein